MLKPRLLTTVLLAIAGVGFMASPAKAALTYTPGDLFIGFHTTGNGSTTDYLVNIGQASNFRDASLNTTITLSLSGIKADLDATFGNDWSTRGDVLWGVFGATYTSAVSGDAAGTLYAGQATAFADLGYQTSTVGAQSLVSGKINSLGVNFRQNGTATTNNPKGTIQTLPSANSYASFQTNNNLTSFSYYSNALATLGTAGSSLNLYRMAPTTLGNETKGSLEGTFSINGTTGAITYTTPVPEPSTYGMVMAAAVVLMVVIRRARRSQNAQV